MQTLIMILNLIPSLIQAIRAIEDSIPGQGQGEQKLAAIRGILEAVEGSTKDLWPKIQPVIEVLVRLFNSTGVFRQAK